MKDNLSFEEIQNLGVGHNLSLSHGRSSKALTHPVDSKEQDEEALGKKWSPREFKASYLSSQQIRAGALSQIVSTIQVKKKVAVREPKTKHQQS